MRPEIFWLGLILLSTALMWIPYVLASFIKFGVVKVLTYDPTVAVLPEWAQRAKKAHSNSVENLVILAPAALTFLLMTHDQPASIVTLLQVYFFARLAHFFLYLANIPLGRTVCFLTGWAATVCIICKLICPV